jgi:hypothetical protein
MLVQRLDHDSEPVPDGWTFFHTAPCQIMAISAKSQDESAHCISRPLDAPNLGLQKQAGELD